MLNKEELKNTYIKYEPAITKEIFDKIITRLKFLKISEKSETFSYEEFTKDSHIFNLNYYEKYYIGSYIGTCDRQIQVSDILGEETSSSNPEFIVGKWYKTNIDKGYYCKILKHKNNELWASGQIRIDKGVYAKCPGLRFDSNTNNHTYELLESLEEIQQYLPAGHVDLIKKEFVLPEKWYYTFKSKEDIELVGKFFIGHMKNAVDYIKHSYIGQSMSYPDFGWGKCQGHIEITLDQFKQYILKEPKKLTIDDVVEGNFYNLPNYAIFEAGRLGYIGDNGKDWRPNCDNDWGRLDAVIPATQSEIKWVNTCRKQDKFILENQLDLYDDVTFELKPKTIEKWSEGSYVVVLANKLTSHGSAKVTKGIIYPLTSNTGDFNDDNGNWICFLPEEENLKWFPTLQEAEEYSKSLIVEDKSIKMKKYVNVTTQEQWDFVTEKLGYGWKYSSWKTDKEKSYITLNYQTQGNIVNKTKNDYYTFQEWLDLNNYTFPEEEEPNMKKLLEEVKRRYPVGTKFKSEFSDYGKIREIKPYNKKDGITWKKDGKNIRSKDGLFIEDINGTGVCSNPLIYEDGKWAEIISLPETKKWYEDLQKGDYVVCIVNSTSVKINNIFKLIEDPNDNYTPKGIRFIDNNGDTNGWNIKNFRKATLEEIKLYEHANKPVDVTTYKIPISEEFDRDFYVKVNSQEEYLAFCDYMKAKGDKVLRGFTVTLNWIYVLYVNGEWILNTSIKGKSERPLSDFIGVTSIKTDSPVDTLVFPYFEIYGVKETCINKYPLLEEELEPLIKVPKKKVKVIVKPDYSLL